MVGHQLPVAAGGLLASHLTMSVQSVAKLQTPKVGLLKYARTQRFRASHFKRMDMHVGIPANYQRLSDALHRRGMVPVKHVVMNHASNFFSHGPGWRAGDPTADYR